MHNFAACPKQDGQGGQVQFAVGRGRQEGKRVPEAIGAQSVDAAVDLGDGKLLRRSVALFHDSGHVAVFSTEDAAKGGLQGILDGKQGHACSRLFVGCRQPRDGVGRDEG